MIAIGAIRAGLTAGLFLAALAMVSATAALSPASADTLILQGSTTFNRLVMEPHKGAIETASGHELTVIPNRTMLGIIALMEGRAHIGMLSATLESEVKKLRKVMPGMDYDRLKAFEISRTRVAFVVHPSNPIRKASIEQIKKILTGKITNWRELGGKDAPIRPSFVGGGGGVITSVEAQLLDNVPVSGPNILYVRTALQLIQIVDQEPNALGIAQLSLAKQRGLPEIVTDRPVEQVLSLITLGEPTPAMQSVIDAARKITANAM